MTSAVSSRSLKNSPRGPRCYRPRYDVLEDRLPPGDAWLGVLLCAPSGSASLGAAAVVDGHDAGTRWGPAFSAEAVEFLSTTAFSRAGDGGPGRAGVAAAPAAPAATDLPVPFPEGPQALRSVLLLSPMGSAVPAAASVERSPALEAILNSAPPVASTPDTEATSDLALFAGLMEAPAVPAIAPVPSRRDGDRTQFGRPPLFFEANVGQTGGDVQFLSRGADATLLLTGTEAVMVLGQQSASGEAVAKLAPGASEGAAPAVVRMQLLGGNPAPAVTGRDRLPGTVNYFLGNDPARWHTSVATYARVEYDEVYPGIDLVWYGNQRQLEYDFIVSPGADPSAIRLNVRGAERLELDGAGDLVVHVGGRQLRQHAPVVYQEAGGVRQEVPSQFVVQGQQVGFRVGAFDAGRPLVIDPVLSYSSYLGGDRPEEGIGIAVDGEGYAYLSGYSASVSFPTVNPFQPALAGGQDAYVAKLTPDGSALVYSTYYGGGGNERSLKVAADAEGNAYLCGLTDSRDLPTTEGAFQPAYAGGAGDAFAAKFSADGSALEYATYLGGTGDDGVIGQISIGLAVDAAGHAYLRGSTSSTDFPTTPGALQPRFGGGVRDAFVTKLDPAGSALVYSTYLGGSAEDRIQGIAVDGSGVVSVAGYTASRDFRTTPGAFQPAYGGDPFDGFVARLAPDGDRLVYATFLGGGNFDQALGLAVDAAGNAYVVGGTASADFPTANAFQPHLADQFDAFVTKVTPGGATLDYSTFLGGTNFDSALDVAVDAAGSAYVTGWTSSDDFPTRNAIQAEFGGGGLRSFTDAYVAKLVPAGGALAYSTYHGGSDDELGIAIAVDPATGAAYVTGWTHSTDYPTANPLQPADGGGACGVIRCADSIVLKIGDVEAPRVGAAVARSLLWPVGGRLVRVGLGVYADDDSDPAPAVRVRVYGDDGATAADVADVGPVTLRLRAESRNGGDGRVYLVVTTARDAAGNAAFDVTTVVVPQERDRRGVARVTAAAAAAKAFFQATQTPPPGFTLLGEGPAR